MKKILTIFILAVCTFCYAQDQDKKVVQISGLTVAGDSLFGVQGVNVINKSERKGLVTDQYGFFSFPARETDTILFSCIGFVTQYLVVPKNCEEDKFTQIIRLKVDTTQLKTIDVLPYPTLILFKDAFVKLELPEEENKKILAQNLNQKMLRKMLANMSMDANMNYKQYSLEQIQRYEQKNFIPTTGFMNPFAWIEFIRQVSKGEFQKKWREAEELKDY